MAVAGGAEAHVALDFFAKAGEFGWLVRLACFKL